MAESEAHIFPTSSRAKHSKEVSYPIGAEALSHGLEGVPQHDRIVCDFYGGRPHDDGKPQIYILNVRYEKHDRRFSFPDGNPHTKRVRLVWDERRVRARRAKPRQRRMHLTEIRQAQLSAGSRLNEQTNKSGTSRDGSILLLNVLA